jgi:precorrin-6A synthase
MKTILVIGIGAGDPDYITMQAIKALNRVDVFFILEKGPQKAPLIALRQEICRRYATARAYRFAEAASPAWERQAADYRATVDQLNRDKQAVFERLIAQEMADGECGGFLIWGDPCIYDSTLRILESIARSGRHEIEYEVIPGISAAQALAARHKIALTEIARPVVVTTGRRLAEKYPDEADNVVVMLDASDTYLRYADQDIEIHRGAYLGTPDEILISGRLPDVASQIASRRAQARRTHGWIMDTYLLRRTRSDI